MSFYQRLLAKGKLKKVALTAYIDIQKSFFQ